MAILVLSLSTQCVPSADGRAIICMHDNLIAIQQLSALGFPPFPPTSVPAAEYTVVFSSRNSMQEQCALYSVGVPSLAKQIAVPCSGGQRRLLARDEQFACASK